MLQDCIASKGNHVPFRHELNCRTYRKPMHKLKMIGARVKTEAQFFICTGHSKKNWWLDSRTR
jgi:hypothetical protein